MNTPKGTIKDWSKVVIVGAGNVGSTCAYALMQDHYVNEIVLIDKNEKKAKGIAMDLSHGLLFVEPTKLQFSKKYETCKDADIIIITAGFSQNPGQSRNDLLHENSIIVSNIIKQVDKYASKESIILMVTNPVDVLTYVALKKSKKSAHKVFGTGTVLDTARFRYLLGRMLQVDPANVDAYILGEHGDSEFPLWSHANVAGIPVQKMKGYSKKKAEAIFKHTRDAAYEIIEKGVSSRFAIGLAVRTIVRAILQDSNQVLPVSSYISNYQGQKDVCMSVPCVINRDGIKSQLLVPMKANEKKHFIQSAKIIKTSIKSI